MKTFPKDPDDQMDYSFDWRRFLAKVGGDTINSFTLAVSNPELQIMGNPAPAESEGIITFWLTNGEGGGVDGEDYDIVCRIVTNSTPPRKKDCTMKIRVRSE